MPRKKKQEDAGEAEAAKAAGLTQDELDTPAKGVPATGPAVKMREQDGKEVGNVVDDIVTVSEDEDLDIDSVVIDEGHLSTDEKVARLAQLYRKAAKVWMVMGLWILLNVFRNNLEDARSKDPNKQYSFNAIAEHPELPAELKGETLRRYVLAAATMKELQAKEVPIDSLDYSHFREISKIPKEGMREKVAKMVVASSATVRQTERIVSVELEKAGLARSKDEGKGKSEPEVSPLAGQVIEGLDEPDKRILRNDKLMSLLLDPVQARTTFNFREQMKIYEKAEKILKKKATEKSNLTKLFASNEANVKFLEDLLSAFEGGTSTTTND